MFQPANNSEQLVLSPLFQSKLWGWVDFADGDKGGSKILIFHTSFKLGLELFSWCVYPRKHTTWSLFSGVQTMDNAEHHWDLEMLCAPPCFMDEKTETQRHHELPWGLPRQSCVQQDKGVCARASKARGSSRCLVGATSSNSQPSMESKTQSCPYWCCSCRDDVWLYQPCTLG